MTPSRLPRLAGLLLLLTLPAPSSAGVAPHGGCGPDLPDLDRERLHLTLRRSAPANGSTVTPPSEIRVWFSQRPQRGSTALQLTGPGGAEIPLGEIREHPEDNRSFLAAVESRLTPGSYRVSWRTMAPDGHVIRGEFTFSVAAD